MKDYGLSHCPLCGRVWLVTREDDCFMPACGCFGHDTSAANPQRLCEACGMKHVNACSKIPKANPVITWVADNLFAFLSRHERIQARVFGWLEKRGMKIISRQQK
jgi:hypothetical protein